MVGYRSEVQTREKRGTEVRYRDVVQRVGKEGRERGEEWGERLLMERGG